MRSISTFFLSDGGVLTVGQRTPLAGAETRDVVLIPAEILRFCSKEERQTYYVKLQPLKQPTPLAIKTIGRI